MALKIITLLTDFGTTDSYVAQMKGVLLSKCSDCCIVDATHQVPVESIDHFGNIQLRATAKLIAQLFGAFEQSAALAGGQLNVQVD